MQARRADSETPSDRFPASPVPPLHLPPSVTHQITIRRQILRLRDKGILLFQLLTSVSKRVYWRFVEEQAGRQIIRDKFFK